MDITKQKCWRAFAVTSIPGFFKEPTPWYAAPLLAVGFAAGALKSRACLVEARQPFQIGFKEPEKDSHDFWPPSPNFDIIPHMRLADFPHGGCSKFLCLETAILRE